MALTHELDKKDSAVTRWFNQWLPNAKPVSQDWNARVKPVPIHRPNTERRIPGTVGTAFDYRLRYYLAATPLEDMVAATGMRLLDPTRTLTKTTRAAPDAFLATYGPQPPDAAAVTALLTAFQESLAVTVERLDPVGRALDDADEELLCCHCYVLGLFEELYRAGLRINSPLYTLAPGATVDDLLRLAPQIWIGDLCALSRLALPHVPDLAREPLYLNPIFAGSSEIGGADADLVSGGCLIDVKTTVDPKFTRTRLLYQLLGYVLLDYDDTYAIGSVGVYLSRQGLLVRWPLNELLRTLRDGKNTSLEELRPSFRDAVLAARAAIVVRATT